MWNALNWSNTAGLYCFGVGILGFVTTGHLSVTVTLAGKAVLAMPVLAQAAATTAGLEFRWQLLPALPELHWQLFVRYTTGRSRFDSQKSHTSLFSDRLWGPPSLLYDGYRISFSVAQWLRRGVDNSPRCSVEVKEKVELYCPSGSSWLAVGWTPPDYTFTHMTSVHFDTTRSTDT